MADERVPVRVWDWPVRAVHWALVALVTASLATGFVGGGAMEWHLRSGYAILALALFRVLWGFAGTRHARFTGFVRGPRAVLDYARSLLRPPHEMHAGHNPLGGWVVVLLLALLLAQAGTGLFANDDIAAEGPLAKHVSDAMSDRLTGLHVRGAWALGGLVALHVAAALFYRFARGENLIRAMVTGVKLLPRSLAGAAIASSAGVRAMVLLGACALAVWGVVTRL
jgi:cytochrome b